MKKRSLIWPLFGMYMAGVCVVAIALASFAAGSIKRFYEARTERSLCSQASLVAAYVSDVYDGKDGVRLRTIAESLGRASGARVTIMAPSGLVLGDSSADPSAMENHADRPEFVGAMQGRVSTAIRMSPTLGSPRMYAAAPITAAGSAVAVARVSESIEELDAALRPVYLSIGLTALAIIAASAIAGYVISNRLVRPLKELRVGAERFARGDLSYKLPIPPSAEVAGLAEAMNQMACDLDEKLKTIGRQRTEQQAVLASMSEGILAVDSNEHVIMLNRAAAGLLGLGQSESRGRPLTGMLRNADLERVIRETLAGDVPEEAEFTLQRNPDVLVEVKASPLLDALGLRIGVLLVLTDVTRLRRLETMRRDFVANVSHELKTPVTAIKGFVETLREGALNDPDKSARFLEITGRQVDRLAAIIDDLLTLSRIDRESAATAIDVEDTRLFDVLVSAVALAEPAASRKKIEVRLDCDRAITIRLNPLLMEQAVFNLVDNAVKYSEPGGFVEVSAARKGAHIDIRIKDLGVGIPEEHLPRIFERFYRVDKSRSRAIGGTGLGLSIVKHIAQAHSGTVSVESTPGKGSTFTISIPA